MLLLCYQKLIFKSQKFRKLFSAFNNQLLQDGLADYIELLSDEMREDYLLSVKKAIVDFVLRDPREKEDLDDKNLTPIMRE